MVIDDAIEILAQGTAVAFVSGLGAARLRLVTPLLAIRGGRLRRRPRCLLRPLQPQNQIDQFVLRKPLQITAIHTAMDSGFRPGGKGVGNYLHKDPVLSQLGIKFDSKGNITESYQKGFTAAHRAYNKSIISRVQEIGVRYDRGKINREQALREIAAVRAEARRTLKENPEMLTVTRKDIEQTQTLGGKENGGSAARGDSGGGWSLIGAMRSVRGFD